MRARTYARMDAGKVSRKTEKIAAKPETEHGIRKKERNFYTDKEKPFTVPQRKTYGSHGGNIRFAEGKHKNNGNITRFSTRGFLKNGFRKKKDTPSRKDIKKGVPLNSNLC